MRTIKILLLSLLLTIAAYGRGRTNGYCEDGGQRATTASINSSNYVMRSYPGCTVTVYLTGTLTLATIYSDNLGTPKANPFTASGSNGAWFYYVNDGVYDVKMNGGGIPTPFTIGAISNMDPYFIQINGTYARLISDKQRDYVSVKDYGATGDGSTNDLPFLQNAANAVCQEDPYNAALHVPAGRYNIAGTWTLPCALEILGDGPTQSVIFETTQTSLTRGITTDYSLTMRDIAVNTTPLVNTNLGMTAVARGFNPVPTSVGQKFLFSNFRSEGFNFGMIISGKDNFTDLFEDWIVEDSYIRTYTSIASVSQPLNGANGKHAWMKNNTLIGDDHGDHAIYFIAIRSVVVDGNYVDRYANSAIKLLTASFGGGAVCPVTTNDYPGWTVTNNTIKNSWLAFAAYTYCAVTVPAINFTNNIIDTQPSTYVPDYATVYIQASCQSVIRHVNSEGNTFYNLGLGGIVLLSSVQSPSDGCADPLAEGTIEEFTSTNDVCTVFSTASPGIFPCINSTGGNLKRATVTNLHSNGGGGPINLGSFQYATVNFRAVNAPVSNVYASREDQPNETGRTVWRVRMPAGYTANVFELYDSTNSLRGNITADAKINFDSVPGLFATNGTRLQLGHIIIGSFTLSSGTVTVTLTGAAVFTSGTTFRCTANASSAAVALLVTNGGGSSFTISDGSGSTAYTGSYICIGN